VFQEWLSDLDYCLSEAWDQGVLPEGSKGAAEATVKLEGLILTRRSLRPQLSTAAMLAGKYARSTLSTLVV
jgi:hypothetical protein